MIFNFSHELRSLSHFFFKDKIKNLVCPTILVKMTNKTSMIENNFNAFKQMLINSVINAHFYGYIRNCVQNKEHSIYMNFYEKMEIIQECIHIKYDCICSSILELDRSQLFTCIKLGMRRIS